MNLTEIERIFHEALQFEAGPDRTAFLDRECGDDQELRNQVERLLRAVEQAPSFLSSPTLGENTVRTSEMSGTMVGRYMLLQKLGEGGFGAVYEAEQQEPIKRRVALKIIKLGLDTRQVVARFEAERQTLALMDHPNIARVLDAGATETGRPYFVMELVRGVRLTHYCDEHRLSTKERLKLFITVCQAVQHAHQKGIIHRDLKPSNILVARHESAMDSHGVPKVIDFGIAKATQQESTGNTVLTQFNQMVGTPAYMSPEQAESNPASTQDIDTRTDIYSLGVLLYEILTGRTPLDSQELLKRGQEEILRRIKEEEPLKPSTRVQTLSEEEITTVAACRRVDPAKFSSELRGDLDWIVMKALEKDRARRYASAQEFANDVQRHLNQEPVEAAAPGLAYRSSKFIRRHRLAIAGGAVVAVILILGTAVSLWQAIQANAAREEERQAKETAMSAEGQAARALDASRRAEIELALDKAQLLGERGDAHVALLWLARSLKMAPEDAEDLRRFIRLTLGAWENRVSPLRLLMPHQERADRLAFSPDGKTFFTAARLQNRGVLLQRWDAGDGHAVADSLEHLGGMVYAMAFSGDAGRLAVGYTDGRCEIINCETGQIHPVQLLPLSGAITAFQFHPDGSTLLVASSIKKSVAVQAHDDLDESTFTVLSNFGHMVQLVHVQSGQQEFAKPLLFQQAVGALAFSPDGQKFVTQEGPRVDLGAEGRTRFWNLQGQELREPWIHDSPAMSVAWSPGGDRLLTGHWDFSARLWDVASGRLERKVYSTAPMSAVDFSPLDGKIFLTGSYGGTVSLWDTSTGQAVSSPMWHKDQVRSAIFSPDGRKILSCARGAVRLRDVPLDVTDQTAAPLRPGFLPLVIDASNRVVLVEDEQQRLQIRRIDRDEVIGLPITHPKAVLTAALSQDLSKVATVGMDYKVRLWNAMRGELVAQLSAQEPGFCVAFSPDGQTVVSGHFGAAVLRWDTVTGKLKDRLPHQRHSGPVFTVQYSEDGQTILSGGADGMARLWDADTGAPLASTRHSAAVMTWFDPTGRLMMTSGTDHHVRLWDAQAFTPIGRPLVHQGLVFDAIFSPDGELIYTGGADQTTRLWDVALGKQIGPAWRHANRVIGVNIWPDLKTLMSFTGNNDRLTSAKREVHYQTMPTPVAGTADEITWWAQAVTGMELESNGSLRPLDATEWKETHRRLRESGFAWP